MDNGVTRLDCDKDKLINSLLDENERLLDQLLQSQSRIEKQNEQLQIGNAKLEELLNDFIDYASTYAAYRLKQENEEALRSELRQKSKKYFHAPVRKSMWRRVRADAGKKFASENATLKKALKDGVSGERIAKIIKDASMPHEQAAAAFTEVARELDKSDLKIEMAFRAWVLHPKPYRLKWLAFRCHDQEDDIRAAFFLDMLPDDASLTKSEKRKIGEIHLKADEIYTEQARDLLRKYLKSKNLSPVAENANPINEEELRVLNDYRISLEILRGFLNS